MARRTRAVDPGRVQLTDPFWISRLVGEPAPLPQVVPELTGPSGDVFKVLLGNSQWTAQENESPGDPGLGNLPPLWTSIYKSRIHVTGVPAAAENGTFLREFELPLAGTSHDADLAAASLLWNHQCVLSTGEGCFADEMERALLNAVAAATDFSAKQCRSRLPLDGNGPQESSRAVSGALQAVLSRLPGLAFSEDSTGLSIHLFLASTIQSPESGMTVALNTGYPWKNRVTIELHEAPASHRALRLRLPGWCREGSVILNGKPCETALDTGYAVIDRTWKKGDRLEFHLTLPVERVRAHPGASHLLGKAALQRGPIVYCFESIDVDGPLDRLLLPPDAELIALHEKSLLGGVTTLHGEAAICSDEGWNGELYRSRRPVLRKVHFKAIPYWAHGRRAPASFRLWMPELV